MASGRSNLRKTRSLTWRDRGASPCGNLDAVPEIDAAGELEARSLPLENGHPGALESALAEAAPGADLADSPTAHLEEDAFELQRERDRELEPREEHLLGEYLDLRVMRRGDRVLGERDEDRLLGRILLRVPVLLELAVLLPAAEKDPDHVHVEDLADLGLDLLPDGTPLDPRQL